MGDKKSLHTIFQIVLVLLETLKKTLLYKIIILANWWIVVHHCNCLSAFTPYSLILDDVHWQFWELDWETKYTPHSLLYLWSVYCRDIDLFRFLALMILHKAPKGHRLTEWHNRAQWMAYFVSFTLTHYTAFL